MEGPQIALSFAVPSNWPTVTNSVPSTLKDASTPWFRSSRHFWYIDRSADLLNIQAAFPMPSVL